MDQSDAALFARCRRGEADAWEALVHRYQRLVWAVPRRAGLDEQLAAEVFQAVFALLVEHLDRIERPDRVGAWLVTTARREAWRVGRRERVQRGVAPAVDEDGERDPLDAVADGALLPDEVVQRLEEQHAVRQGLAALDARCRALLTSLFYAEAGPSYDEIAARLGMPVGSIGPTRARCLQKLRRLLGPAFSE